MDDTSAMLLLMIGYAVPICLAIADRIRKELKIAKQNRRIGDITDIIRAGDPRLH